MPRFPNWTWSPWQSGVDRLDSQEAKPAPPARPCLPSVEKLDGRLLFSVNISDIPIVKHIDKSSPMLAVAESNVLTPVQGLTVDDKHKEQFVDLGHDFLKVNDILLKYEQDILNAKVTPTEGADTTAALNDLFLKIESLATSLDGGTGALLPAVQKVYDLAVGRGQETASGPSILADLSALADQLKITPYPDAEADGLAKMAGDFWKLGEVALNYKLDLIQGVPTEVAQKQATTKEKVEYLKIELEQVLVSGFISPTDQQDLAGTLDGAFNLVNGVINPSIPTVGLSTPAVAGDTIS